VFLTLTATDARCLSTAVCSAAIKVAGEVRVLIQVRFSDRNQDDILKVSCTNGLAMKIYNTHICIVPIVPVVCCAAV